MPLSATSTQGRFARRRAGLWLLAVGVVLFLLLIWAVEKPRRDAARLLTEIQSLQPGETPYAQVVQLVRRYPGESVCYEDDCSFHFQNRWLHRLGLAPLTQLHVILHRRDSRLVSINAAMIVVGSSFEVPPRASAMVFDDEGRSSSGPVWRAVVTHDSSGDPVKTIVQLSSGSSTEQRRRSFNFNLKCLTRWGGCKSSRDLLPDVWTNATQIQWVN